MFNKIQYWHRIIYTYLLGSRNNISFWHGEPELNDDANYKILDQYYMKFYYKAKYTGSMKNTNRASNCLVRLPLWEGLDSSQVINAMSKTLKKI